MFKYYYFNVINIKMDLFGKLENEIHPKILKLFLSPVAYGDGGLFNIYLLYNIFICLLSKYMLLVMKYMYCFIYIHIHIYFKIYRYILFIYLSIRSSDYSYLIKLINQFF